MADLSPKAQITLDHAKRVFADTVPARDPWTREARPVMFASIAAKYPEAIAELVAAGYLTPAPGTAMWGFYVRGERLQ